MIPAPIGQIGIVTAIEEFEQRIYWPPRAIPWKKTREKGVMRLSPMAVAEARRERAATVEWLLSELAGGYLVAVCQGQELPAAYWKTPAAQTTIRTGNIEPPMSDWQWDWTHLRHRPCFMDRKAFESRLAVKEGSRPAAAPEQPISRAALVAWVAEHATGRGKMEKHWKAAQAAHPERRVTRVAFEAVYYERFPDRRGMGRR